MILAAVPITSRPALKFRSHSVHKSNLGKFSLVKQNQTTISIRPEFNPNPFELFHAHLTASDSSEIKSAH